MKLPLVPAQFVDLDPLAETWALATQRQREDRRRASSPAQLRALYDAVLPRMEELLTYLDQYALDNLPEAAKNLLYLTLSLAEVAPYVECYQCQSFVPDSFEDTRFIAVHGDRVG
jgi:hypothetical protein